MTLSPLILPVAHDLSPLDIMPDHIAADMAASDNVIMRTFSTRLEPTMRSAKLSADSFDLTPPTASAKMSADSLDLTPPTADEKLSADSLDLTPAMADATLSPDSVNFTPDQVWWESLSAVSVHIPFSPITHNHTSSPSPPPDTGCIELREWMSRAHRAQPNKQVRLLVEPSHPPLIPGQPTPQSSQQQHSNVTGSSDQNPVSLKYHRNETFNSYIYYSQHLSSCPWRIPQSSMPHKASPILMPFMV